MPSGFKSILSPILPPKLTNKFRRGEVYVVSFPKCGRTWLKLMLTDLFKEQFPNASLPSDVSTEKLYRINNRIPRIVFTHDDDPHYKLPEELSVDKSFFKETKVIFLVRDPRDVIISWYFEYINRTPEAYKLEKGLLKSDTPSDFIYNNKGGLKTIVAFYNLWLKKSQTPLDFTIIKYEDLVNKTGETLSDLLNFFSISDLISKDSVKKSVKRNSFDNVQKREKVGAINVGNRKTDFGHDNVSNNSNLKARRGKIGGFVDYLDPDQVKLMDEYIKENLDSSFGY